MATIIQTQTSTTPKGPYRTGSTASILSKLAKAPESTLVVLDARLASTRSDLLTHDAALPALFSSISDNLAKLKGSKTTTQHEQRLSGIYERLQTQANDISVSQKRLCTAIDETVRKMNVTIRDKEGKIKPPEAVRQICQETQKEVADKIRARADEIKKQQMALISQATSLEAETSKVVAAAIYSAALPPQSLR